MFSNMVVQLVPFVIPNGSSGAEVWPELAHKIEEFGAQTFLLKSTAYVFAKARAPGYRNIMKHVRDGKRRTNVVHWRRISWGEGLARVGPERLCKRRHARALV